ncbi:hypothetical protein Salat_0285600 [Sesamum alatum]|uniref:Uncharacterized protein n=1 Tax=Sesamum alatum TaxID=300844 RepID=A0AAE1Z0E3_9LAMI|nr:hypothetical protein Salat_0285600 [Sesamum alatum]
MGCISSKAIARSMSIREELNHGFQSRSAAWEELLTSHGGNDQLFALVCSANTMTTKLRTSTPSTDPDHTPPDTKYLANAWDLIPDITGKAEVKSALDALGEPEFGRFTRSKSCQILGERDVIGLAPETGGLDENKLDGKDKNLTGSRSFHTVEEYDALLERTHKFRTRSMDSFEDNYPRDKSQEMNSSADGDQNDNCIHRTTTDSLKKEVVFEADCNMDCGVSSSLRNFGNFKNVVQVDGTHETGWKRKAIAKGLKSLDVPTIDFPAVARLRQRIHAEGQVYSPGTYITPKFGSYNAQVTPARREKEGGENSVFSPELVAAFENCVRQLQEEEDSILSYMDGCLPVEDIIEKRSSTNMKI